MVVFAVSRVERAKDALPTVEPREAIESLAGRTVEAWWRSTAPLARAWTYRPVDDARRREAVAYHPFVAAVHAAFDGHRPLVLSPDAVWLCIAQGFATHVQVNGEALRSKIVAHQGRELIAIRRDDFVKGATDNPWPEVFAALASEVGARTGELHDLVVADFSTTDAASRAASSLALLAAAQPYFAFQLHTLCGIPEVTLTGTVDDWRAVARRAAALAPYDTGWWIDALKPVLEELIHAADGRPDVAHWRSLYKLNSNSGGPYVTGWINVLLPYLLSDGRPMRNGWAGKWRAGLAEMFGGGPTLENLPSGIVRVPFLWKYLLQEYRMEFIGGFTGVGQDPRSLAVHPELGWAIGEI